MLVYGSKDLILTRYTDSDFQTDIDCRKSTSGSLFILNGGALVWRNKKIGCMLTPSWRQSMSQLVKLLKSLFGLENSGLIWKLFQTCQSQFHFSVIIVGLWLILRRPEATSVESILTTSIT